MIVWENSKTTKVQRISDRSPLYLDGVPRDEPICSTLRRHFKQALFCMRKGTSGDLALVDT